MAAQFMTTSRLSNIINMIALGRQSGILRIIRGQGPTREIGQIKFLDGEPVSALLGQLTGQNALTVLANWGECIYSFDEQAIGDADGEARYDSSGRVSSDAGRYVPTGPASGSWPSPGYVSGYSNSYPTNYPTSYPTNYPAAPPPMSSGISTSSSLPAYPQPNSGYGASGTFGTPSSGYPTYDTASGDFGQPATPTHNAAPLSANQLTAVPRRTVLAEHVDQLPLDRRERMLLLLVDGRRTLSDLGRLTRRNEREVLGVLEHLSTLGLVQIAG